MRSAVAYLSTYNLLHNLTTIKSLVKSAKCIAMVKANAYGHGLRSTAIRLEQQTDFLGVASIDEALQLFQVGIRIPIVLMEGIFEAEELTIVEKYNFQMVLHNRMQLQWLMEYINRSLNINPWYIWIKIDTGMGRLGFSVEEGLEIYKILLNYKIIARPIGLMSHLACADNSLHILNKTQIDKFNQFIQQANIICKHNIKSLCNSAALFNFPVYHYDVVRPGISLYGGSPLAGVTAKELGLKPVMKLTTKIISIKTVYRGSSIGYGARFICPRDLLVGIIAIGYGDGYPRTAQDGNPVLVKGKRCGIVGRVSMDLSAIDLSNCLDAKIGDEVVLWGGDLPIEEVAKFTNNSVYDLLTAVQYRVKFIWE